MTAAELIGKLSLVPPDAQVMVQGYETGYDAIHELQKRSVAKYRRAQPWNGEFVDASGEGGTSSIVIIGRREALR